MNVPMRYLAVLSIILSLAVPRPYPHREHLDNGALNLAYSAADRINNLESTLSIVNRVTMWLYIAVLGLIICLAINQLRDRNSG